MFGYIYKTTNLVNNKIYIGQHKAKKFEGLHYIGSGKLILEAIEKYGKQNFKIDLLCECENQQELDEKEIYYISEYKSNDRNIGYNILAGGQNGNIITEETKQKNRERLINTTIMTKDNKEVSAKPEQIDYYLNLGYIIGRSKKAKQSLSENYNYSSKGMLGKHQSDKQKQAASKACSYKRSDEQKKNFSNSKKIKNKFVCLRTPDNKSTIRCLIINKEKYLKLGYIECNNINN